MCGILGGLSTNNAWDKSSVQSAVKNLSHRGPDENGTLYLAKNCFISHVRLSILDLSSSKQPMVSQNGDYIISFNGEIYNYVELKKELEADGVKFQTKGDTEVLLQTYLKWGKNTPQKLRGMFAFAIWDKTKNEFFLARDHFGIKPLYVYSDDHKLGAFASEISAFKSLKLPLEIDYKKCGYFFKLGYCPPEHTLIKNVIEIQPGYCGTLKNVNGVIKLNTSKYVNLSLSSEETIGETFVEKSIRNSIESHLVSDVPFGAYLSGGIDSTLIVKMMSEHLPYPVKTFNIKFKNSKFDESKYAQRASERYGNNFISEYTTTNFHDIFPKLTHHFGQPFGDSSAIPTYQVAKETSKHVKMVLSGDGGDELFGGYSRYTKFLQFQEHPFKNFKNFKSHFYGLYNRLNPLHVDRNVLNKNSLSSYINFVEQFSDRALTKMINPDLFDLEEIQDWKNDLDKKTQHLSPLKKAQWFDYKYYLPGDILKKVDITSMMNSIESRTPFIDIELFQAMATLNDESLIIYNQKQAVGGKKPLKDILARDFDSSFVNRPKAGFTAPINDWMNTPKSKSLIQDILAKSDINEVIHTDLNNIRNSPRFYTVLSFLSWVNWINE